MKYILLLCLGLLISCGKPTATLDGKLVSYDEHTFRKQVDIYSGEKKIKEFKYRVKRKDIKKEEIKTWITDGSHSCSYSGFCSHYSYSKSKYTYGFYHSCSGSRYEKRSHVEYKNYPSIEYKTKRKTVLLTLSEYNSKSYTRLKTGTCK